MRFSGRMFPPLSLSPPSSSGPSRPSARTPQARSGYLPGVIGHRSAGSALAAMVCAALVLGAARPAQADPDQSLEITLPSNSSASGSPSADPGAGSSLGGGVPANSAVGGGVRLSPPDFDHLAVQAIGTVNQPGAQIVRRAGAAGIQVLFTCSQGQTVPIVGQLGDWYCVLMADQSVGCIVADRVSLTWDRPVAPDSGATGQGSGTGLPTVIFPDDRPHFRSPGTSVAGQQAIDSALRYLGVPYRWGGNTADGIDCSGLVKACFRNAGIDLPRTAREQAQVGESVDLSQAQAGDRLSFACHGSVVDHTGIYLGNGEFIHASGGKGHVVISKLEGPYLRWLVSVRRDVR